jgi:hypothetical protein
MIPSKFDRCHSDATIYTQRQDTDLLILVLHVDDLILKGISSSMIKIIQNAPMRKFDMTNLRLMHYFLGLQVLQSSKTISIFNRSMHLIYFSSLAWLILNLPLLHFS